MLRCGRCCWCSTGWVGKAQSWKLGPLIPHSPHTYKCIVLMHTGHSPVQDLSILFAPSHCWCASLRLLCQCIFNWGTLHGDHNLARINFTWELGGSPKHCTEDTIICLASKQAALLQQASSWPQMLFLASLFKWFTGSKSVIWQEDLWSNWAVCNISTFFPLPAVLI